MSDVKSVSAKNVVSLNDFRKKKTIEDDMSRGRSPLYVSHLDGTIKGRPQFLKSHAQDFGDRLQRIKSSLERISNLMNDVRSRGIEKH